MMFTDGLNLISEIRDIYDNYAYETEILADLLDTQCILLTVQRLELMSYICNKGLY